jgi:hypothetical protein
MKPTSGRGWAYSGFVLGISTSVAGNILDVFVRMPSAPIGAVLSAAIWPLALLISLEVIARVQWPKRRFYQVARYGGLTAVASIAAFLSHKHMAGLLAHYGEDRWSAALGPLVIDGLMVVSSVALLAIADNVRRAALPEARTPPVIGTLGGEGA